LKTKPAKSQAIAPATTPLDSQGLTRDQATAARRAAMTRAAPVQIDAPARALMATWDAKARTIDLVLATDTPVARQDWTGDIWQEILSCAPGAMRDLRCNSGRMSLTIDHGDYDSSNSIGLIVANSLRFEQVDGVQSAVVTARINDVIDGDVEYNRPIVNFERGNLPNTSCRYQVYGWTIEQREGAADKCTAVDWEPLSLSPVATPADPNAYARAFGERAENPAKVPQLESTPRGALEPEMSTVKNPIEAAPVVEAVKPAFAAGSYADTLLARSIALEPQGVTMDELRKATAESKDDGDFTDKVISHLAVRSGSDVARHGKQIEVGNTAKDNALLNLEAGLFMRAEMQAGQNTVELLGKKAKAKDLQKLSEMESRAESMAGANTLNLIRHFFASMGDLDIYKASDESVARAFLGLPGGYQSRAGSIGTGDLPSLAANLATKTLVPNLQEQFFPFQKYCQPKTVKDFKLQYPVTFDGIVNLPVMAENQKFTFVNLTDSKESYQVSGYGQGVRISDRMIMADDLGALRLTPIKLQQAAMRTRVANFFAFLAANANLSDGNALFSAAHLNVMAYQAPTTIASFDAQRQLLKAQKGKAGEFLELMPWGAIVGDDVLTGAQQATGTLYSPVTVATAIPQWAGKIGVDGAIQLSGLSTSYLFADPGIFPAIIFATLESATQNGMALESRINFENRALEITLSDAVGFGPANSSGNGVIRNKT